MRPYLFCLYFLSLSTQAIAAPIIDNFFSTPDVISAKLSPNGQYTATINSTGTNQHINLITNKTLVKNTIFHVKDFTKNDATIRNITWIDNRHIALQFSETRKGVKDLVNTQKSQHLLIVRLANDITSTPTLLSVKTKGWLVDPLAHEDNTFLYAKGGPYSKVYRINTQYLSLHKEKLSKLMKIDGGQFIKSNEVASVEGYAIRWFINQAGKPMSSLNYIKKGDLQLSIFDQNGKATALKIWPKKLLNTIDNKTKNNNKILVPIEKATDNHSFYCLDLSEENERSVYKVNFSTNEETLIFEADSYKIVSLILNNNSDLLGVTVINNAEIEHIYLDDYEHKKLITPANHNKKGHSSTLKTIVNTSINNTYSLLFTESHNQPGQYLIKNEHTGKTRSIGSAYPQLVNRINSQLIDGAIIVEGLKIPYLLTLPHKKKQPAPLIVVPHGGPIGVFDQRYFDQTTQYLAANGYAVLRVNFRGSSGYSKQLKEAGKKQWGNLILEDIHQASLAVSKRKDINASKICVFGMSYGGYAATMLVINHPETYRCAVNVAGVSDVNLYLNKPRFTNQRDAWALEYIGDTVTNYDALKAISPVYQIDKLTRPILIMHGAKDNVVDIEHAYRLKRMLDKHQKKYSWHIFPEMKHSFSSDNKSNQLFSKAINFIQQQLDQNE